MSKSTNKNTGIMPRFTSGFWSIMKWQWNAVKELENSAGVFENNMKSKARQFWGDVGRKADHFDSIPARGLKIGLLIIAIPIAFCWGAIMLLLKAAVDMVAKNVVHRGLSTIAFLCGAVLQALNGEMGEEASNDKNIPGAKGCLCYALSCALSVVSVGLIRMDRDICDWGEPEQFKISVGGGWSVGFKHSIPGIEPYKGSPLIDEAAQLGAQLVYGKDQLVGYFSKKSEDKRDLIQQPQGPLREFSGQGRRLGNLTGVRLEQDDTGAPHYTGAFRLLTDVIQRIGKEASGVSSIRPMDSSFDYA